MKLFRDISILFMALCMLMLLSSCSRTGDTDLSMFISKFNENMNEENRIEFSELMTHNNTYYAFFPSEDGGDYMLTISEDEKGKIFESGICIVGSIPVNTSFVEALFSSELYSMYDIENEKASEIFKSLKLNESDTYKKESSSKNSMSDFIIEIIVNEAGTGIYIYDEAI